MFHEAAEYVKNELLKLGLKDAQIEQFPADGTHRFWTHISPVGWEVKSAELRLIEPEERLLVTYEETPQSLHTHSKATPSEGITAELVEVGAGTKAADYKGRDVKGKFVLATGRARFVHRQAVYKYGAAGVITDAITLEMPDIRESLDIPDAHAYQAIWPTDKELSKAKLGFSLSHRQGRRLRALLGKGRKVKLNAKIDARLFPGKLDIVTATIRGKSRPKEEVFLVAHLCHPKPSANDNASGSGLLLEMARTIETLINKEKIQRPARTIRFMWVPETTGTVAYLSVHKDVPSRMIVGINLDMVGQNQELCKSTLSLDRTPDSLPSYLNDYIFSLMEESVNEFDRPTQFGSTSTFRYRSTAFSGGSDHAEFTEATTKVPCIMLLQWPDLFYHTSMDVIDKVSEDSLKRVGWIATVAALTLANADAETSLRLANHVFRGAAKRIVDRAGKAIEELYKKTEDRELKNRPKELTNELVRKATQYRDSLEHVIQCEQQAMKSVKKLGSSSDLQSFLDKHCKTIKDLGQREIARIEETLNSMAKMHRLKIPSRPQETKAEKESKKIVPNRLFKGTLSKDALREAVGEKGYEWYLEIVEEDNDFDKKLLEIVNFMNGQRTVYEIIQAVIAEYGETNADYVLKFVRDLERAKLVIFK